MTEASVGDWRAGLYRLKGREFRGLRFVAKPPAPPSLCITQRSMDRPCSPVRPDGASAGQRMVALFDRFEHTYLSRTSILPISEGRVRG